MKHSRAGTYGKILLYLVVAGIALALLLATALTTYLATPHGAVRISRMLSAALGQPVAITHVDVSGGALHLKGLSLADPEGFPASKLLAVDSITIAPAWLTLLSDTRTFETIRVEGVTVDLRRNKAGVWNFAQLQRRLSSPKPSSTEILIRRLEIAHGTVQVNGQRINGLSLNLANLATKGSESSGFTLEFDDQGRNHYALSGTALLGKNPELQMVLSSSSISLKSLPELLKSTGRYLPEQGTARLRLSAELRKGVLHCTGEAGFSAAVLSGVGRGEPFSGTLSLAAGYDTHKDLLTVEHLVLRLNRLPALRVSGSMAELKGAKRFSVDAGTDAIDIDTIAALIPELKQRNIALGGTLQKGSLHLGGTAVDGITIARGNMGFARGSLRQEKRLLFNNLDGTVAITATGRVLTATGNVTKRPSTGEPILETLDAPFTVVFDRRLRLLTARLPALSARAYGVAFTGGLSYGDGIVRMEHAAVQAKDISVALKHLSARIPVKKVASGVVRYPVNGEFSGCNIRRDDARLTNLSGSIRGAYAVAPKERWLEGAADIHWDKVAWQGKEAGAATVHGELSRSGGSVNFKAPLLGGSVAGRAAFNPAALRERVEFGIDATGIQLAEAQKFAGQGGATTLSGGTLDAGCTGVYSRTYGISGHVDAQGKNITLTGAGGKTLLSAAGIKLAGDLSGQKLEIRDAVLTVGKGVSVTARGALEHVFQPDRHGRIVVTMPRTSLEAVVDSFLNVMPRSLQEATVGGSIAADGVVNLGEGAVLVDGAVTLADIGIDAPAGKITVAGVSGVLPVSLDLAGKTPVKLPATSAFTRRNYDALVTQLHRTSGKADTITIGRIGFGGVGVDSVNIRLRAARGVTEITSLDSSLYGGTLLGKGFIAVQNGLLYRGDLLLGDLSLVTICKAFPAIAGYISGKIDGIVSIQGKGTRLSDLSGFTELWAREAKGEKMLVSKEFLQRLSGKKLSGFFFSSDRAYDHAGIRAALEKGFLAFDDLDISHTNFLGIRDLSVSIVPSQNRIAIDHLLESIQEAAVRGKGAAGATDKGAPAAAPPPATEFKWNE